MASKDVRGEQALCCQCATFRRCYGDPLWEQALSWEIAVKQFHMWDTCWCSSPCMTETCSFLWKPSVEKLLNGRHHFYHVPPCCSAMQAFPIWGGKGMKPTWALNRELTIPASWHLGTWLCLGTGNHQLCGWRQLHPEQRPAGLSVAAGCWIWMLDLSPQGAHGKAAGPGLVPAQRDCMETKHPKFLLRRFQAPVFSWWHAGLEISNSRRVKSPSPTAGWSPKPGAVAAIAPAPLYSHGNSGNVPLGPAAPASTLCILADFRQQWLPCVWGTRGVSGHSWPMVHSRSALWAWHSLGVLADHRHCHGLPHGGWERDKPWSLLDGSGWKPGGTHCCSSRQLHWIKACEFTPVSKDMILLAPEV